MHAERLTVASVLLSAVAMLCCATPVPAPDPIPPARTNGCEYLNAYVNPKGNIEVRPDLEPLRRTYLHLYGEAAERLGLRIVHDPADAWMELWVGASWTSQDSVRVEYYLSATLKLEQHFFVALMADPAFPYRGLFGSVNHDEVPSDIHPSHFVEGIDFAIQSNWANESRQILALCDIEGELVDEGWSSIDELRDELIREMERARRNRRLSIGVELETAP